MPRTLIKWTGLLSAAVLLSLVLLFVISFYRLFALQRNQVLFAVERGAIVVNDRYRRYAAWPQRAGLPPLPPRPSWFDGLWSGWSAFSYSLSGITYTPAPTWRAWPYVYRNGESVLPLWIPMLLCASISSGCAYVYIWRRPRNHCPCGHNLAGLPSGAPCPECGQAAKSA